MDMSPDEGFHQTLIVTVQNIVYGNSGVFEVFFYNLPDGYNFGVIGHCAYYNRFLTTHKEKLEV
jgi:hypothetical protein